MWTNENRAKYKRDHLRYPSDVTDAEWAHVEPLIPLARRGGRKREANMREVFNGVMYVLSTGCQWRYIPKDFPPSRRSRTSVPRPLRAGRSSSKRVARSPPKSAVNRYFCDWAWDGTLDRLHDALYEKCREQDAREASPPRSLASSHGPRGAGASGSTAPLETPRFLATIASPAAAIIDSQSMKGAEKGGPRSIRTATMQARGSRARSVIFS